MEHHSSPFFIMLREINIKPSTTLPIGANIHLLMAISMCLCANDNAGAMVITNLQ